MSAASSIFRLICAEFCLFYVAAAVHWLQWYEQQLIYALRQRYFAFLYVRPCINIYLGIPCSPSDSFILLTVLRRSKLRTQDEFRREKNVRLAEEGPCTPRRFLPLGKNPESPRVLQC